LPERIGIRFEAKGKRIRHSLSIFDDDWPRELAQQEKAFGRMDKKFGMAEAYPRIIHCRDAAISASLR
jgi:hypothetical protein